MYVYVQYMYMCVCMYVYIYTYIPMYVKENTKVNFVRIEISESEKRIF